MAQVAKLFKNGRSQAVRLPAAFRFEGDAVFIRQDPRTGDVILSKRPTDWAGFFAVLHGLDVPDDFLARPKRKTPRERDPFKGWKE